jgi:hypothetical protein
MRVCGTGPEFSKLGRKVVYKRKNLDKWLDEVLARDAGLNEPAAGSHLILPQAH